MAISLQKGQRVSLNKVAPGLNAAFIGLGWDVNTTDTGADFDLDASVFLLNANEKLISDEHFIFYLKCQKRTPVEFDKKKNTPQINGR